VNVQDESLQENNEILLFFFPHVFGNIKQKELKILSMFARKILLLLYS
jgi:hypothetical protein